MRFISRGRKIGRVLGIIILGLVVFAFLAQMIYVLLAGGAFRWLRPHDSPYNYPGSTWESENPQISLQVVDNIPEHVNAYLLIDGIEKPVILFIDDRNPCVDIYDASVTNLLLKGSVRSTTNRIEITVNTDMDYLYGGAYSEIVLFRTDTQ